MAPISIKYGANDSQQKFYFDEMSKNSINFSVGFSEFFGSRNESNLVFLDNKVNGRTFFVIDNDYATHVMLSDKKGQIGVVNLKSAGIKEVDLTTVDKTRIFREIRFNDTEIDILKNTLNSNDAISLSLIHI